MFRSIVSRRIRVIQNVRISSLRGFQSTRISRTDVKSDITLTIGQHLPYFHDLFRQIHDLTTLPWIISIPLVTILIRGLLTPARYYYSLCHRDRILAKPKLELATRIIEKQNEIRLAAGTTSAEQNYIWRQREWQTRRAEIEKQHSLLTPHSYTTFTPDRILRASAISLVLINTSTITALSLNNPELIHLSMAETLHMPLIFCFAALAISNTNYYNGNALSSLLQIKALARSQRLRDYLSWTPAESMLVLIVGLPLFAASQLYGLPGAVILSSFSNSVYTLLERKVMESTMNKVHEPIDTEQRAASQRTRRNKKRLHAPTQPTRSGSG